MLVGMPAPRDLHRSEVDGQVFVAVGATVLFSYAADDAGLRNLAGDAARDGLHRASGRPGAGEHRGVRVDAAGPDPPRGLGRADAPAWAAERAAGRGSESGSFLAGGGADRRSDRGPSGRARHDGGPGAGWGRAAGLGGGRRTDHPGGPGVARAGVARAGAARALASASGSHHAEPQPNYWNNPSRGSRLTGGARLPTVTPCTRVWHWARVSGSTASASGRV